MEALSIGGTIALLKEAGSALQAAGKIDLWNKIVALQAQLIDMQLNMQSKDEELRELTSLQAETQAKLDFSSKLTFQGHWYVAEGDLYPYCMTCWETKKLAVHLSDIGMMMSGYRRDCFVCKSTFIDPA